MDVLTDFPVRKSKKQKQAFRDAVQSELKALGYPCRVEKGSLGSRNLVAGDSENAEYLITAHYDTCAWMPIPNFITPCNLVTFILYQLVLAAFLLVIPIPLGAAVWYVSGSWNLGFTAWYSFFWLFLILLLVGPANPHCANDNTSGVVTVLEIAKSLPQDQRNKVCFVLFDLEEAGLIGSASYRKKHKQAVQNQIVLNLDCVGDGDNIVFFPTKKLKQDQDKLQILNYCAGQYGNKQICIRSRGFSAYPSDQANFPYGAGICALRKKMGVLYLGRIHTRRDTILEQTNVNLLRAAIVSMICCGAVK